jgi:hypothetical protein
MKKKSQLLGEKFTTLKMEFTLFQQNRECKQMKNKFSELSHVLLSMQKALLGSVVPALRAVAVDVDINEKTLFFSFFYDCEINDQLFDLATIACTEASANFPEYFVKDSIEQLDYPKEIPALGHYAYLRKEPYLPSNQKSTKSPLIAREIIDFQKTIGIFVSPLNGERVSTNWGIIHHAYNGTHIVPARPINNIEIFLLAYAMLSLQKALLGNVTPELRAVVADINERDNLLYIRCYYGGEVDKKTLDLWERVITESWADFGSNYKLDSAVVRLDYPLKVPFQGRYAYLRKE